MLGEVTLLRRYPVKSMLGEDLPAACVTAAGLAGDRRLALVHAGTGKVASAKYPRLWRNLLHLRATTTGEESSNAGPDTGEGAVRIVFPDGRALLSTDASVHRELSELLGQPVTLTGTPPENAELDRAVPGAVLSDGMNAPVPATIIRIAGASPAGTFFDYAPLHLLTTSTLGAIARHGGPPASHVRYRPNIVIRTSEPGFTENAWAGRDLAVGPELRLRIIARTPRCAVPVLPHGPAGERDPDALRAVARLNRIPPADGLAPEPCAGVYAQVLRPGPVRVGDTVTWALAPALPPLA